jgi:hypothetical protein
MAKQYGGLKTVAYSTNGSSFTTIAGKISSDSAFEPGLIIETETTDSTLHGGTNTTADIGFFDDTAFSTLLTAMESDTEYYFKLTYNDGTIYTSSPAFEFKVKEMVKNNARDGLSMFRLTWNKNWFTNLWTKS